MLLLNIAKGRYSHIITSVWLETSLPHSSAKQVSVLLGFCVSKNHLAALLYQNATVQGMRLSQERMVLVASLSTNIVTTLRVLTQTAQFGVDWLKNHNQGDVLALKPEGEFTVTNARVLLPFWRVLSALIFLTQKQELLSNTCNFFLFTNNSFHKGLFYKCGFPNIYKTLFVTAFYLMEYFMWAVPIHCLAKINLAVYLHN